jgi:EmrB/QacA subfamily drug resistance transporter
MNVKFLSANRLRESSAKKWVALVGMCLVTFIMAYNTTAVITALTSIQEDFKISFTTVQWIVNAYMLVCAAFIIIAGRTGHKYGYRNTLLVSSVCFLVASIIIALASNIEIMLAGRVMQGLGASFMAPTTLAITKKVFPEKQRLFAISAWSAALSFGLAIGPVLGGIIIELSNWRYIFWVNIPFFVIALMLVLYTSRPNYVIKKEPIDMTGAILLIFGMVLVVLGLVESSSWGWGLPTILLILLGLFVLYVFWLVEKHTLNPLIHFRFFRIPQFGAGLLGIAIVSFCFMGILYYFNKFFQSVVLLNYSPFIAGLALLPVIAMVSVSSLFVSPLNKKFGFKMCANLGLLLLFIGFIWLATQLKVSSTYGDLWFPLLLCGIGVGVALPTFQSICMGALPDEHIGEAAGMLSMVNYLAGVLSICLCGIVYMLSKNHILLAKIKALSNIAADQQQHIYNVLVNISGAVPSSILAKLNISSKLQQEIITMVKQTTIIAFSNIMWTIVGFIIIGVIVGFVSLRRSLKKHGG